MSLIFKQNWAILYLIVEGIEYEGISELLWGKSLIWGETILFHPSLAPTLTSTDVVIWNINNNTWDYRLKKKDSTRTENIGQKTEERRQKKDDRRHTMFLRRLGKGVVASLKNCWFIFIVSHSSWSLNS